MQPPFCILHFAFCILDFAFCILDLALVFLSEFYSTNGLVWFPAPEPVFRLLSTAYLLPVFYRAAGLVLLECGDLSPLWLAAEPLSFVALADTCTLKPLATN
ncbi:MAG TPA: hypothetical protein VFI31_21015 [Pirellulales bacterium]|nr:hypothetical protein [Pirellulales bacterium]